MSSVVFAKMAVSATVGGTKIPVTALTVTYGLNMVPHAVIKCAIGTTPGGESSEFSSILESSDYNAAVEVVLECSPEGEYPFGDISGTLFSGYLAGPRIDAIAQQTVGGMIDAVGQLADLASGSKLSWLFDHVGIDAMFEPAWHSDAANSGTYGLNGSHIDLGDVSSDLWTEGMLVVLKRLADEGVRLRLRESLQYGNQRAVVALDLIKPHPESSLGLRKVQSGGAFQKMKDGLAYHLISTESGANFWDTIINYCALWSMAVVPTRTGAYIVPFVETANGAGVVDITKDHIWSATALNHVSRANLRGVVITGEASDPYTGKNSEKPTASPKGPQFLGVADGYTLGLADQYGQFRIYQWPSQYVGTAHTEATITNIPGGRRKPNNIPSTADASGGTPPAAGADERKSIQATNTELMDGIAEARLRRDLSMGYSCRVFGPLRLDICPGTQVLLHLPNDEGNELLMRGVVAEVVISADADQPYFGTGFTVTNLRTEEQDQTNGTSVHPVFTGLFIGDRL